MGVDDASFGALLAASMTGVVGVKLAVGSSFALLSSGSGPTKLLLGSAPFTLAMAVFVLLAAGGLVARLPWCRGIAVLALTVVVVVGWPSLGAMRPLAVGQTGLSVLTVLYLALVNPVQRDRRSPVDESESASRLGSTIR